MEPTTSISAKSLLEALTWLEVVTVHGEDYLNTCLITSPRVQKPALALAGHFNHIRQGMVELFGATELAYIATQTDERMREVLTEFARHNSSLYIVSKGLKAPAILVEVANSHNIPVVEVSGKTMQIFNEIAYYLDYALSEEVTLHGVCAEVYGLGIILTGRSGIGKSECALELIKRGHRLVADDVIRVKRRQHYLIATSEHLLRGRIELRGVGALDISKMYGVTAVRPRKKVDMLIDFLPYEEWHEKSEDRLAVERLKKEILGLEIPLTICPVSPGRNMSEIVELAAKNRLLQVMGYDSTKDFLNAVEAKAEFNKYGSDRW